MNARLVLTNPDDAYEFAGPDVHARFLSDPRAVLRSSFVTWRATLEVPCPKRWRPPWSNAPTNQHPERCICGGSGYIAPSSGDTYEKVEAHAPRRDGMTIGDVLLTERLGVADAVHVIGRDRTKRLDFGHGPDEFWLDADLLDAIPSDVKQVFYVTGVTP